MISVHYAQIGNATLFIPNSIGQKDTIVLQSYINKREEKVRGFIEKGEKDIIFRNNTTIYFHRNINIKTDELESCRSVIYKLLTNNSYTRTRTLNQGAKLMIDTINGNFGPAPLNLQFLSNSTENILVTITTIETD